jgi:hypothetical protein
MMTLARLVGMNVPDVELVETAKETAERFQEVRQAGHQNLRLHPNVIEAIERQLRRVPLMS